jgi:hypothetical protein
LAISLTFFQPLRSHQRLTLGAVAIAATVEGDALVAAGVTSLGVAAKRGSSATLDRAHDAALPTAEGISMRLTVGRPGLAKDIRHLEPGGAQRRPQK